MSEQKIFQIGVRDPKDWDIVHELLSKDGTLEDNIPCRCIECVDIKEHSPTRSSYLMTDDEAEQLRKDPRIIFANIDYSQYDEFKPPPDELQATTPDLIQRYSGTIKNYRRFSTAGTLPTSPGQNDANRSGYQLLRCQQNLEPWISGSYSDSYVYESTISQYGTGKHVDVVVADEGMWIGHPEFQNNSVLQVDNNIEIEKPNGYAGGNVLPGNGTCDVLDLVLDSPYYIDPEWFDADPDNRLTTRWDGTRVPVENVARAWWSNSSQRSEKFANAGTVIVPLNYTRFNTSGNNTSVPPNGEGRHGTPCGALTFGRTQGWAYNANKWNLDLYGSLGAGIEQGFDIQKIFHQLKPVNPLFGTKNPTVSSNSWGYRANKDPNGATRYYTHRSTSNVAYTSESGIPWLSHMGTQGDGGRWKSEMKTNSFTTALQELIESGVIFVAAAGNSNQKQVDSDHPDYNNYITATNGGTLDASSFSEFELSVTGTTNRRGFPQQGGMYNENGKRIYPVINIGALDDNFYFAKETKVGYSDRGNSIDVYAPADGTLAANSSYTTTWPRADTYPGYRQTDNVTFVDNGFSAVCSPSAVLNAGTFVPAPSTAASIITSAGSATVTSINLDLKNITANPDTTPTSFNPSFPYDDEAYWTVPVPWTIQFNGTSYNEVHVGSNSYLTFGGGSQVGFGPAPSATSPAFNKIMISADDSSCQRIYTDTIGISPNRLFVIRYQGHTTFNGGVLGAPTMEYEYHFYENAPDKIEVHVNLNGLVTNDSATAPAIATDTAFSGTSAACPVAAGFIATVLEWNRDWTWQDVRRWLQNLDVQDSAKFYYGDESATATTANWNDYRSLEGGDARVLYQGKIRVRTLPGERAVSNGNLKIRNGLGFKINKS